MYLPSTNHKKALMTPNDFITPNLLEIGTEIVRRTKEGYVIKRGPELLGYQYYVEFEKEVLEEVAAVVAPEAPKRGPKPKKAATESAKESTEA